MTNQLIDIKDYMADLVYEYVPGVKRVGSNRLNFKCPICGDGKKHTSHRGWFYLDNGTYFCWNAGCPANEHGMSGLKFLSIVMGKPIAEVKADLISKAGTFEPNPSKYEVKSISGLFGETDEKKSKVEPFIDKIKDGAWTDLLPKYAEQYVESRKLLQAPFLPPWFKFYFDNKLKRLVIPWSNEYYQERTILKSQWREDKYKFPFEIEKPIFGIDMLDKNFKYVFLCEGVFDSIWVKNGLAVGSLRISNSQQQTISELEKEYTVVYMPDNQFADTASMEFTLKTTVKSPYKNIFIWPKTLKRFKDINETIIFSDKFIEIWKNEKFLTQNISNGLLAQLKCKA